MMRQGFENNLRQLQQELIDMGSLVEAALQQSIVALKEQDLILAQKVIDNDEIIDDMQMKVEDKSLMLIALQQPIAKDLRTLSAAIKIPIDLERMGDHAKNIAEVTIEIGKQPLVKPLVDIPKMAEIVCQMLKDSLQAYVEMDVQLAEAVCVKDDEVDDLCDLSLRELLTYMIKDPATIEQASQLLYIARCLERAGDHATNIAESVVYLVTGQRYKGN